MAINNRIGAKVPKAFTRESTPGVRVDSGPYIGIVKNVIDPTRSGRVQVFIPDLGGVEDNPSHWRTVSYASPFFGSTHHPAESVHPTGNTYKEAEHTYGFWFTPPDVGNELLITFVMGDPARGYWFACIVPQTTHHMVPGIAASTNVDTQNKLESAVPVTEFNVANKDVGTQLVGSADVSTIKKPIHEAQYATLLQQGLDRDTVRGTITSSSQRESPSTVFGFSTPGRSSIEKDPKNGSPTYRLGGHTFVMDDGDVLGKDQLVRLRTAGGHQLLMNDTEGVVYVANGSGNVWLEFTKGGSVNMFCNSDFNLRARGNINLHSDTDINMFAKNNIKMYSGSSVAVQTDKITLNGKTELSQFGGKVGVLSGSSLNLQATSSGGFGAGADLVFSGSTVQLNSMTAPTVPQLKDIKVSTYPDAAMKGSQWVQVKGQLSSIATVVPTHEPWHTTTTVAIATTTKVTPKDEIVPTYISTECGEIIVGTGSGGQLVDSEGKPVRAGDPDSDSPGFKDANGAGVTKPCPSSYLSKQPDPKSSVGTLTIAQTKSLMSQIGYSESNFNYSAQNQYNYIGKYQFGAAALETLGYLRSGSYKAYGNAAVNNSACWIGKDGLNSKADFFNAESVQESIMVDNMQANYKQLSKNTGVFINEGPCVVAGMLMVSHLLGAAGAKNWRNNGGGSDANGTTGSTYFNRGRYAATVLVKNLK